MAVCDRLPHGDDVGDEVVSLKLEGPEMAADTAEAHLDLIGDDHAPGPADVSADAGTEVTAAELTPLRVRGGDTYAATCWK